MRLRVDTETPPGYRLVLIEEGTDDGMRLWNLDPHRVYLFTQDGRVVRHESGS